MLLNKNIKTKNPNSFYHFLIGLIFLGMTAWVAITGYKKVLGIDQFDWVYIALFGITGIWFTIKGLKALFSKAYIKVDDIKIDVKSDETSEATQVLWKNIDSIKTVKNTFHLILKNGKKHTINLSHFDYENADELKKSIQELAKTKDIAIIVEEEKAKYVQ